MRKRFFMLFAVVMALGIMVPGVLASSHLLAPFTQAELDTNWEVDRYFPTAGATSVSAFGRDDVARIGIDSNQTQSGTFQRTEGIKTVGDQDFGNLVEVDLYVDSDWQDKAVRAGVWVVGDDGDPDTTGTGSRDNCFGIIEFVNLEPSDSGDSAQGDHQGWRIWDSSIGWTDLSAGVEYDAWVTLGIELDAANQQYIYSIDGDVVGTVTGGDTFIREVFLNSYNYGLDEFPNLSNDSYAAHWHNGDVEDPKPEARSDCMRGGWADFGFKNQGQCIASIQSSENSQHNR